MLLSKAVEGYLLDISANYSVHTVALYKVQMRKFLEYFGEINLDEIDQDQLSRWLVYMRTEYQWKSWDGNEHPLGGSALDNYWKMCRSFFGWARKNLKLERPDLHLPRPRYLPPQILAFTRDEVKRILYACEWTHELKRSENGKAFRMHIPSANRNKALILMLLDTGLRIGEVSRLTLSDVDLETGQIIVAPYGSGQKTKPRLVYLGRSTKKAVWHYIAKVDKRKNDPFFTTNSAYLRRLIAAIGERAKVPDCHPHRFRHTFAIEYLRNGGDPFTLQRLLGHSTLEMSRRYLNILEGDYQAVHEKASPADHWKL